MFSIVNRNSQTKTVVVFSSPTHLRTVPTEYKGFRPRLGPCEKRKSLQGLLESTKKNGGSHEFFRDK